VSTHDDLSDPQDRFFCVECTGDKFFRNHIELAGDSAKCSYCRKDATCITIGNFADKIEGLFEDYFEITASQPDAYESLMMGDKESEYDWQRKGEPAVDIIADIAMVDKEIAGDAQKVLEERHGDYYDPSDCDAFGEDTHYEMTRGDSGKFPALWLELERSLITEARLFNRGAQAIMEHVFVGITNHTTRDRRGVVCEAGPSTELPAFYRARVIQDKALLIDAILRPDRQIGPPPTRSSAAGRMNARGISVFYGATAPEVALAEVRPPVGSRVVVARFTLTRSVRLLNVEALRNVSMTLRQPTS
jgi:hypothetical protein